MPGPVGGWCRAAGRKARIGRHAVALLRGRCETHNALPALRETEQEYARPQDIQARPTHTNTQSQSHPLTCPHHQGRTQSPPGLAGRRPGRGSSGTRGAVSARRPSALRPAARRWGARSARSRSLCSGVPRWLRCTGCKCRAMLWPMGAGAAAAAWPAQGRSSGAPWREQRCMCCWRPRRPGEVRLTVVQRGAAVPRHGAWLLLPLLLRRVAAHSGARRVGGWALAPSRWGLAAALRNS
jgi:hypothetical protein